MKESIQNGFPSSIHFPEELGLLCDWVEKNGYPISGDFELRADDGEAMYWWFRSHAADDRLAQFGAGPDGSMYCIWRQKDGRSPVVHMGSEGNGLRVLACDMKEFLQLLAVGYGEMGFDDLSQPPGEPEDVNPSFQDWVTETFSVEVPKTGLEIVESAIKSHDNFEEFVNTIVGKNG